MYLTTLNIFLIYIFIAWLFFALPNRCRLLVILSASLLFYFLFSPIYIFVLLFIVVTTYVFGRLLAGEGVKNRKYFFIASILLTLLPLIIFKYYDFTLENITQVLRPYNFNLELPKANLILPIGLSFYTFQSLSYLIEVYKKKQKPERNFWIYSAYIIFYPKILAGPIERPQHLLDQFRRKNRFSYQSAVNGLKLMAWGLFKKIVIADRLVVLVNQVYSDPYHWPSFCLFLATLFFTFQIYCDFSAYSDIAIGAARIIGFSLVKNFDKPYFSSSPTEFWRRWHMSLSFWFRDYIYISLGGNRVSIARWSFNLIITFLIAGLWHGANWTFIFWGFLNSLFIIFSSGLEKIINIKKVFSSGKRILKIIQISSTFMLIFFSWIFFRAQSLTEAFYIVPKVANSIIQFFLVLAGLQVSKLQLLYTYLDTNLIPGRNLLIAFSLIIFLLLVEILSPDGNALTLVSKTRPIIKWVGYYLFILSILLLGIFGKSQFVYFKF